MKFFYIFFLSVSLYAQPSWLNNTNNLNQKFLYGIGVSNDINPVSRRQVAIINARANLAENIKVTIKSYFKIATKSNNSNFNKKTESIIEQKANELLINSSVEDSFLDDNGILYILIKINKLKISSF